MRDLMYYDFDLAIAVLVILTKCITELLGGWGSVNNCVGVCPKLRIWFSIA